MQKTGYTFTTVYNSKCVSVFLHQTIGTCYLLCRIHFLGNLGQAGSDQPADATSGSGQLADASSAGSQTITASLIAEDILAIKEALNDGASASSRKLGLKKLEKIVQKLPLVESERTEALGELSIPVNELP